MQSENLKKKIYNSLKKISSYIKKDNKIIKFLIIFLSIFVLSISFILFFTFITNFKIEQKIKTKIIKKDSLKENILKMAEKDYEEGFFENSAIKYMKYLTLDLKKSEKVIAYKKLFEISIKQKKYADAIGYLNEIERIEPKIYEVYINKLKLFLRLKDYESAKREIEKNKNKLQKSIEFKELISLYYDNTGETKKALEILTSIKPNKRDFKIHKKILIFFLKLNKVNEAIKYLNNIEKKSKILLSNKEKAEFYFLKALVLLFNNNFEEAIDCFKKSKNLDENYERIANKFIIFARMHEDNPEDIFDIVQNNEEYILSEITLIKVIGDYFIKKHDYKKALYFYKKLAEKKDLLIDEVATLADLYYLVQDYENSIKYTIKLFIDYKYDYPLIYKNLSLLYLKINNNERVLFFLKEGLTKFPEDIDLLLRTAKFYIDNGQPETALKYLEKARYVYLKNKEKLEYYGKQIEILSFIANKEKIGKENEKDLLLLREKSSNDPSSYFKLIEFYLKNHKYTDAKREIDTVKKMKLSKEQSEILANYQIMYFIGINEITEEYESIKSFIFSLDNPEIKTKINLCILLLFENDFDNALKILSTIPNRSIEEEINKKILYLKALCYYYKQEYPLALKIIKFAEERNLTLEKTALIKSLVLRNL